MKLCCSLVAILALSTLQASEDLGTLNVNSSTIDINTDLSTESSSIAIIDEETIDIVGSKNITDILRTVPGMTNVARAGEVVQFKFRGVGAQQYMGEKPGVAIIIDGIPVMSISGGVRLNLDDIKSVKVIKGSASYLYGDTALSGAVIITTKKLNTKSESSMSTEFGSYGFQNYQASTTQNKENFSFNLNGSYRKTDGYWTDSEMWTKSANGKFSYYLDDTSDITVGVDITDKYDQGGSRSTVSGETAAKDNPKGEEDTGYNKDSGIDLDKYYLSYNKDFDNSSLQITTYKYNDLYELISNPQDTDNDTSTKNIYVNESHDDLTQKGIKLEYTTTADTFASLFGIEIGQKEYKNTDETLADYSEYNTKTKKDENYYDGETSLTNSQDDTKAFYGELKYSITPKFTTTINGRYDIQDKKYTTDSHDFDGTVWSDAIESNSESFRNTAYKFGTNYSSAKNLNIFTNIATGYETPDVTDLAETPSLKNQTSITYEVGSRGQLDNSFTYETSIYQMDNKDILGPEEGTYGFGSPMANIGDSRHRGLEISLKSDPEKTFSYSLAYTYLSAKYTSHLPHTIAFQDKTSHTYDIVGNDIPRVSKHTLDLFINYKVTEKLKFITEIYAKSSYWADEMNMIKMDGYEILNLQARYNTKISTNTFEFFVKVENLFDKQYYRAAYLHRDKRGDLGIDREDLSLTVDPGRVYYAGIKYIF